MTLLLNVSSLSNLQHLKGSIAGVYSLSGGVGILLLTKLGGMLFDRNTSAPFVMLALFNAFLLVVGIICGLTTKWHRQAAYQQTLGSAPEAYEEALSVETNDCGHTSQDRSESHESIY